MRISSLALHGLILLAVAARSAPAQDIGALEARLKKLESANAKLQQTVEKLTREVEILRKTAGAKTSSGKVIEKKPSLKTGAVKKSPAGKTPETKTPAKKVIDKKLAAAKVTDKKSAPEKNVSKKIIDGKTPAKKLPAGKEPLKKPVPEKEALKKQPDKKVDEGELIDKSKAVPDKSGASVEIPKGKVVVTVKIELSPVLKGVLRPEDKVDVYATYISSDPEGKKGSVEAKTKRILSAAEVFSLDAIRDSNDQDDKKINTVSLLIDPDQAEVLLLAAKNGTLTLALRKK